MQDLLCGVASSAGRERREAAQLRTLKDDDGNPLRRLLKALSGWDDLTAQTARSPWDTADVTNRIGLVLP